MSDKNTKIPSPPPSCWGHLYTVKECDTLYKISKKYKISLKKLIAANPQISDPDKIYPNQKICIPEKIIPEPPVAKYCRVKLKGTDFVPKAIGFASIRFEPARVTIACFDLPKPAAFGYDCKRYSVWIVHNKKSKRFRIDMKMIFPGVWVGDKSNGSLVNYNDIFVTPEPIPGCKTPTGPKVLYGSLKKHI